MNRSRTSITCLFCAFLWAISFVQVHAVVYSVVTDNTVEPTNSNVANWTTGWGTTSTGGSVTGWDYVGTVNGASGVYLGNGWVIAAAHEGVSVGSTYVLNGVSYSVTSTTTISGTDIVLFQISSILDLPSLTISSSSPTLGSTSVVMIGYSGGVENWGYNTVTSKNVSVTPSGTSYVTTDFATAYGSTTVMPGNIAVTNYAYAQTGDSGGAAFSYNSSTSTWVLMGMMEAVDSSTNSTYFVQLSSYYSQISSIIAVPENSTLALLFFGCALLSATSFARKHLKRTP